MATTRGGEHSGPRSGKNAPKVGAPKKGSPKMTAAKWAKLTSKQKQEDYNGSRFMQVDNTRSREGAGANPRDVSKTRHSARYGGSRSKQAAARSMGRGGVGPNKR